MDMAAMVLDDGEAVAVKGGGVGWRQWMRRHTAVNAVKVFIVDLEGLVERAAPALPRMLRCDTVEHD